MYTFSTKTVAEFYGRKFFSIKNSKGEIVAYSEKVFEITEETRLFGGKTMIFKEAKIRGGEIWGGVIRGGVIRGGVIRGGVIRGGVIRGGVIEKTPLQIQGSKHYCIYTKTADHITDAISIGCQTRQISEWLTDFVAIGTENDYSFDEINEYSKYIQIYARRYAPELLSPSYA